MSKVFQFCVLVAFIPFIALLYVVCLVVGTFFDLGDY